MVSSSTSLRMNHPTLRFDYSSGKWRRALHSYCFSMPLTLRPFGPADETPALAAWAQFKGTGFDFLTFDFDPSMSWSQWTD